MNENNTTQDVFCISNQEKTILCKTMVLFLKKGDIHGRRFYFLLLK